MSNIKNYIFNKFDLSLSDAKYWDFYLVSDNSSDTIIDDTCLASSFDFNNSQVFPGSDVKTIKSLTSWSEAINTGYTFSTIGLTGIDNGLISYDSNSEIIADILTGSTLNIIANDTKLYLTQVSGSTNSLSYPIELITNTGSTGNYINLNGGFYQGYYKLDGTSYQVLPNRANKGWVTSIWLNKQPFVSGNTLNDLYPDNRGFFFYIGTRSENKFWNKFSGETDIFLSSDYQNVAIPLNPPRIEIDLITNPFLIYGRSKQGDSNCLACNGNKDGLGTKTVCTYDGKGIVVTKYKENVTNTTNSFLIYGRSKAGEGNCISCGGNHDGYGTETICSFSGFTSKEDKIDYNLDIIDNSLGFRIKEDGSIGYRLLTLTGSCSGNVYTSGITMTEAYSPSGVISNNKWQCVTIRYSANDFLEDCELESTPKRTGNLLFYVDGRLVFSVNDFKEFIPRRLDEYKSKQVGVPFNISIGGGTQGLIETQTFSGPDPEDLGLPIQENFAGSFNGFISQVKLYNCDLNYLQIKKIYDIDRNRYL